MSAEPESTPAPESATRQASESGVAASAHATGVPSAVVPRERPLSRPLVLAVGAMATVAVVSSVLLWQKLAGIQELLARQSAGDVSAAQVCENLDSATAHIDLLLRQAAPLLAGLSRQLDVTQLQHLKRHFAEEDREWRDKWLDVSPERRTQLRLEDWTERAQSYYGRLTREQREFILRAVQRSSWDPQLSWERRQLRQQQILVVLDKIIRQRLSQTAAEEEMLLLIERSLRPEDVRIAGMQRMLLQEACNNLSGLHQLSTEAQRLRARDKLVTYEQDFRQLAAKR
mgnify:CR=1 FL=1